jgi:hypothetical protein
MGKSKPPAFEELGLSMEIGPGLPELVHWLEEVGMLRAGHSVCLGDHDNNRMLSGDVSVFGLPCTRSEKRRREELKRIRARHAKPFAEALGNTESDWSAIYHELRNLDASIRELEITMIPADALHNIPLMVLAESVFPRGYTALTAKPYIPTYLVGTPVELEIFAGLVPSPNEAYTSLFWPGDTKGIDAFIKEKRKQERTLQKPAKNQLL